MDDCPFHTDRTPPSSREGFHTPVWDDEERHTQYVQIRRCNSGLCSRLSTQRSQQPDEPANLPNGNALPIEVVWKERVRHYTWTFFTMTMATGGMANVLYTGSPPAVCEG